MTPLEKQSIDWSCFENPYLTPEEKEWMESGEPQRMAQASIEKNRIRRENEQKQRMKDQPQSSPLFFSEERPVDTTQKSFLRRIRDMFGMKDPALHIRQRPGKRYVSNIPAAVELLEPRVLMSASTPDLAEDVQGTSTPQAPEPGPAVSTLAMEDFNTPEFDAMIADLETLEMEKFNTPEFEAMVADLAAVRMEELEKNIHNDAADLPALLRQEAEMERTIADGEGVMAQQQKTVQAIEKRYDDMARSFDRSQAEYKNAVARRNMKVAARVKEQMNVVWRGREYAANDLLIEKKVLSGIIAADQARRGALATIQTEIQASYAQLSAQSAEYVACAELTGMTADIATEQAEQFVFKGIQEGEEALPHVRATIDVRDRNTGNGDLGISVLPDLVKEVRSHTIPRNMSTTKVLFRVSNDGNRDGYVTVTIGGVSDLSQDLYKPQSTKIFLHAGEKRDIVGVVEIPQGSDGKRTGGLGITVTTPDESAVVVQMGQKGPKTMWSDGEKKLRETKGALAVKHNAEVIALSEGVGTPEERLAKYLAANPSQASVIAKMMQSGELTENPAFTQSFLAAHKAAISVAGQMAGEVVEGMEAIGPIADTSFYQSLDAANNEPQYHYNLIKNWYNPSASIPGAISFVNTESEIGSLFSGLLQQIDTIYAQNESATAREMHILMLAKSVEKVTDIPYHKIVQSSFSDNSTTRFMQMKNLFEQAQYQNIFEQNSPNSASILSAKTDNIEYANGMIRIRFDIDKQEYDSFHVRVYQMNGTQQVWQPLTGDIRGQLFVDIPVSDVAQNIGPEVPYLTSFKVIAWFDNNPNLSATRQTDPVTVRWNGGLENGTLSPDAQSIIELPSSITSAGSNALLKYIADNFETTWNLKQVNNTMWEGEIHGTGLLECKAWLDDVVVKLATGVDLPTNTASELYGSTGSWNESNLQNITRQARVEEPGTLSQIFHASDVKAGDIVQVYADFGGMTPHTMLIGKIESDGIWVLDTNYGGNAKSMELTNAIDRNKVKLQMKDPLNNAKYISENDAIARNIAFEATHYLQKDNTIRYHKWFFEELNQSVIKATIYRVTNDQNG